jgi:hypothetical protein
MLSEANSTTYNHYTRFDPGPILKAQTNTHTKITGKTKTREIHNLVNFLIEPFASNNGPGDAHKPTENHFGRKSFPLGSVNQTNTAKNKKNPANMIFSSNDILIAI